MINRIVLAALGLAGLASFAAAEPAPPARIVSINLCADELLLALADPGQIAALSIYATDPDLSFMAEAAEHFRHDAAAAETVVDLKPDLVLAGRFTKRATRDMLKRLGYRVVELDAVSSIAQSVAQIGSVAALVGHADRGAALIAAIEAAEARARAAAPRDAPPPTAVFYQRRGYVTGGNTLTNELMAVVGLANQGGALAGKSGGFVSLERLVVARPDYLVVGASDLPAIDQGSALLAHPALTALYPPDKRILLPNRLTVCGGPSLPAALDWLSAEAARIASPAKP